MAEVLEQIGKKLKEAREGRSITLAMAETDTKIRKKYLEALEEGREEELPGETYTKGFLRTYGNYLGLNGAALVKEYKTLKQRAEGLEEEEEAAAPQEDGPTETTRPRRSRTTRKKKRRRSSPSPRTGAGLPASGEGVRGILRRWLPALLVAGLGVFVAWLAFAPPEQAPPPQDPIGDVGSPGPAPSTPPADPEPEPEPEPEPPPPPAVVQGEPYREDNAWYVPVSVWPGPVEVTLEVREGAEAWYEVKADGEVQVEGIFPAGSETYTAEEQMTLTLGWLQAIRITVNGEDLGYFEEPYRRVVVKVDEAAQAGNDTESSPSAQTEGSSNP